MSEQNKNSGSKSSGDCLNIAFINKNFDALIKHMHQFGIDNPKRIKYFLAQCYHETGGFKHFKENLNYSAKGLCKTFPSKFNESNAHKYARNPTAIANVVYNNKYGNNNKGDGAKYIGRGLIQITFKDNYKKISEKIGNDIVNHPELVSNNHDIAIKSACAFFEMKGLNGYADKDNMKKISRIIQGSECSLKAREDVLKKIENSSKYKEICKAMDKYKDEKKNHFQIKPSSNTFPSGINSNNISNPFNSEKDKNNNFKDIKGIKSNNNNNNSSEPKNESRFFSLDNRDIYLKALKEELNYQKNKGKNIDNSTNSNQFSQLFSNDNKEPFLFINNPNNKNPPSSSKKNKDNNANNTTKNNNNYNNILGGIDFGNIDEILENCRNITFQGLISTNSLLLFNEKNISNNSVVINLEDVAVILKILYEPTLKYKNISFSLDPYEPNNPGGPYMRKVFYPDKFIEKKLLQGTKIGEEMFKADYILKQMALGYINNNEIKFEYPKNLLKKGLRPIHLIEGYNKNNNIINRQWIVTKKIETISRKSGLFYVTGIKLGVEAREMEISKTGILIDKKIQNSYSPCYKFAEIFSNLYDEIADHYPIFNRLKEISGAMAIAKYIYDNHYPIEYNLIEQIYKSTLIPNYHTKINSICHHEKKIYQDDIISDPNEVAKQYLLQNNMEINYNNLEMAKEQIKNKNIRFTGVRKQIREIIIIGGIDLWSGIVENKKNILNESANSISTDNDDSHFEKIDIKTDELNIDITKFNLFEFPFLTKNQKCSICNKDLNLFELRINESYKDKYDIFNAKYCSEHNPFNCAICHKLIIGEYIKTNKDVRYHKKCLKCVYCLKEISGNFSTFEEDIFHIECFENYKDDIRNKERRYIYDNLPDCEFCDEKIDGQFIIINNYNIHNECFEKISKKGVDQGKMYILDGLNTRCYICKKIIIGEYLVTIDGLCHKNCLDFIKFIIYACLDFYS